MAVKESDVVLNFKMDGQVQYARTIKEINQEMNLAATEYKNQVSAMDKDATQTEKLRASKQKLEKQVELASQRTKQLREEYENSVKETGQYSEESQKLYKKLLDVQTGENKLKDALETTNEALKEQGDVSVDTAKKLLKIEESGEKIKGIGEKWSLGISAPLAGIGALGIKTASDLSTAQTQIQAAFGLTGDEAENLNVTMERVFASGMVESIDEAKAAVIDLINQMPALKNESSEVLQDMILQAKGLEQTFDSDYEETLKGANALMTAYGLTGQEAMDLITVGTQNGLDKTHELGDNLAEYATLFKDAGWSAEDMFQILQGGLESGSYNLDRVNDLVKEFAVRVSDGTIEGAMEGLSQTSRDAYQSFQDGNMTQAELFQNLAGEITDATSETDRLAKAAAIFGTQGEDAGSGVIEAMSMVALSGSGVKTMYDDVTGAGKEFAKEMEETVTYQSAMNELMLAGADIGEVFAPMIQKGAQAISGFAQWFQSLDQGTKTMIATMGLVLVAVGPLMMGLGSFMGAITKITTGIRTLQAVFGAMKIAMAANPFVLVIAGIVALIAMFVLAYNKIEWFRNGVNAFMTGVKDIFVQGFNFVSGFLGGIFTGIIQNFQNMFDSGMRIFTGLIDFITGIFTGDWEKAWNGIVNIFGGIFDGIGAMAKAPINGMIGLINGFLGGLNNIKIPDWVPKVGGKSFSIAEIPYLAKGGHLINGSAIVGEAGPELLQAQNGKTTVTPLSDKEKRQGINGKNKNSTGKTEVHIHINEVNANNPSDLDRANRKMAKAAKQAIIDAGGVPG